MTISNMSLFGLFGWMWCFWWMNLLLFWGGLCNGKKQYLFLFDIEWITSCRNIYAACWGWRDLPAIFFSYFQYWFYICFQNRASIWLHVPFSWKGRYGKRHIHLHFINSKWKHANIRDVLKITAMKRLLIKWGEQVVRRRLLWKGLAKKIFPISFELRMKLFLQEI